MQSATRLDRTRVVLYGMARSPHSAASGRVLGGIRLRLVSGGPGMAGEKSAVYWDRLASYESAGRAAQEYGHGR